MKGSRGGLAESGPGGEETDLAEAEEEERVEIVSRPEQAPVETGDRAVAGDVLHGADHIARRDLLAQPY
ncbi:hypothetical protein Psi01_08620 [Planobispora siamensis]|uniref:Uncharacterized protein n=1 Tax=Planobispora siamensis TaxID=936338 RepID=A0A8J3S981_9ACTN|nr:hypothetical protein Psi01_08620 [Planobispora siamensis]